MLNPQFVAAYNNRRGEFYRHVSDNTALTVKFKAPVRFYGATGDTVVPWRVSLAAGLAYQQRLGNASASGVDFGPKADHRSAFWPRCLEPPRIQATTFSIGSIRAQPLEPHLRL